MTRQWDDDFRKMCLSHIKFWRATLYQRRYVLYKKVVKHMVHSRDEILNTSKNFISQIIKLTPKKLIDDSIDKNKISFKIKSLEYLLAKRIINLAKVVIKLINGKNYLAAIMIIRGIVETTSMLYWLSKKIEKYLEELSVNEFNDFLMKLIFGSKSNKNDVDQIEPFNILKAIDAVTKDISNFRRMYDILCDYTHPNYFGLMDTYSNLDVDNMILEFIKEREINYPIYLGPFAASLGLAHKSIIDINNNFTKIRELYKT